MAEWYCPNCDMYLIPERVTFEETCVTCGEEVGIEYSKCFDYEKGQTCSGCLVCEKD